MKKFKGIGLSSGIAIGKVVLYTTASADVNIEEKDSLPLEEKKNEFHKAIEQVEREMEDFHDKLVAKGAKKEAEIFQAHILFLKDPFISTKVENYLAEGYTLVASLKRAFEEMAKMLSQTKSEYFRERIKDVEDVARRVINCVLQKKDFSSPQLLNSAIVIAKDLAPSEVVILAEKGIKGFVTEAGGLTSHMAIITEALGIPAVIGVKGIYKYAENSTFCIIDGKSGTVIIDPSENTIEEFESIKEKIKIEEKELDRAKFMKAVTTFGKKVDVYANIAKVEDADIALKEGAEGVGLFRTEFLFLDRDTAPTEEEQFGIYRAVAERFGGKPVIIRTIDIGGDKQVPYLKRNKELNPSLGVRGIRMCLSDKELFKTQLRALLRASAYGRVKIMYPMIAVEEEVEMANKILNEVKKDLSRNKTPFDTQLEVGIMIEIPSAALNAERLAEMVDFFSIGTNDLIQYTFASDRTNENLTYLYQPLHPAITKLIEMTVKAAHKVGKRVGVCGEIAGEPTIIPRLVKMDIDELSVSPLKIPRVKGAVRNT